jgi:DDE_Tnp_1-associated
VVNDRLIQPRCHGVIASSQGPAVADPDCLRASPRFQRPGAVQPVPKPFQPQGCSTALYIRGTRVNPRCNSWAKHASGLAARFRRGKISKSMPGTQIASRLPGGRSISSSPCSTRSPTHAGPKANSTSCLLFPVPAVITGGNSFRSIETFIKVHRRRLNAAFGLHWKRAPAHTAIRYILQGLDPQQVERVFRRHAAALRDAATDPSRRTIAR